MYSHLLERSTFLDSSRSGSTTREYKFCGCTLRDSRGNYVSRGYRRIGPPDNPWSTTRFFLAYTPLFRLWLGRILACFLDNHGGIAAGVTITDFLLPNVVAKKRGASKAGTIGSLLGMFAGMALIPPLGLFVGAYAGAVIGELSFGKDRKNALRAGWGVFLGSFLSMTLKLCYAGITGYFYMRTLLS